MERMILDPNLKLPKPWNGFGVRDLGVRVWGGGSSGGRLRELGEGVCSGEGVRERERFWAPHLNVVGPKTVDIGQIGQTGCRDRSDRSSPG